jgi:oxygen-independent coproporphyrinogen-3 oxidase
LDRRYSKHNLGYWTGKQYLGFGPSAHSFNGKFRRWNHANNSLYMQEIENGSDKYFEQEFIDSKKAFNEYLLTALRTKWGIDMEYINEKFGPSFKSRCLDKIDRFSKRDLFIEKGSKYSLNRKGKFISDYIIAELIV